MARSSGRRIRNKTPEKIVGVRQLDPKQLRNRFAPL
jgi:hypothetical protein